MAFLAALGPLGTAISAAGTIVGGLAGMAQGNAQAAMMEHRAKMERQQAMEARAIGTRQAMEKRREGDLMQSKLQARAAASGGGAADPTVIKLGQDIAGRSEYSALFDMYQGENRARGYEDSANASMASAKSAEQQGKFALLGSLFKAGGTIMGGAGSMKGSYNPSASAVGGQDELERYLYRPGLTGAYG
jgi:hypothetical protein